VSINVRIIAAANRDFEAEVAQGRFREDLYWRLNVVPINLLSLRERRQDIRAIAAAMLLNMRETMGGFAWLSADALQTLMAHDFPGNARELNNILQRAMIMRSGDQITSADLHITPTKIAVAENTEQPAQTGPRHDPLPDTAKRILNGRDLHTLSREIEFEAIRKALNVHNGNRRATAEMLGISERTLRYRLADMRDLANAA
jgi:two-component system response regulator FlrC